MKFSGLWVFFLVLQISLLLLDFSTNTNAFSTSVADMALKHHNAESNGYLSKTAFNRKLKDIDGDTPTEKKVHTGDLNLDDYHPIDPVPSSKTSLKPGPIEHGSPIIPYIPNPSPPDQPIGGFP